jgi:hypothetical protein
MTQIFADIFIYVSICAHILDLSMTSNLRIVLVSNSFLDPTMIPSAVECFCGERAPRFRR